MPTWADMVRLGAYKPGADPEVDEAIRVAPRLHAMLSQAPGDKASLHDDFATLAGALGP